MKRLWRWILSFFKKRKDKKREADINELRFRSPSMFKKFARLFTGQWRTTRGPNMPKMQPCPECGGLRKRDRKTRTGAFYKCNPCGFEFLVVNKAIAVPLPRKVKVGAV